MRIKLSHRAAINCQIIANIGYDGIAAVGSIVIKDVLALSIVAGKPTKVIKTRYYSHLHYPRYIRNLCKIHGYPKTRFVLYLLTFFGICYAWLKHRCKRAGEEK